MKPNVLCLTVSRELVVTVADEGQSLGDSSAPLEVLAAEGAAPGGLLSNTKVVATTVATLDREHHQAALCSEDDLTHTVDVRPDGRSHATQGRRHGGHPYHGSSRFDCAEALTQTLWSARCRRMLFLNLKPKPAIQDESNTRRAKPWQP